MKLRAKDIKEANSTRYFDERVKGMTDPQELLNYCTEKFQRGGYTIVDKQPRKGLLQRYSGMTTVGPGVLWRGHKWEGYTVHQQASVMVHEIVHLDQIADLGYFKFALKYANPRGRWILEMQASLQELESRLRIGYSRQQVQAMILEQAELFRDVYFIRRLDFDDMRRQTLMVMQERLASSMGRPNKV